MKVRLPAVFCPFPAHASHLALKAVGNVAEQLLKDALELDLADRAALAAELLASLDGVADEDTDAAWADEIQRRASFARAGASRTTSWVELRDRLREDISAS